jgi:hypothetical protein
MPPDPEDLPTPVRLLVALGAAIDLLQEAQDAGALLPHDMQRTLGEVLDALQDLWERLPRQAPALWRHWPEAGQEADETPA